MGGFSGFGQSGTEKSATSNLNNLFNTGLGIGTSSETTGNNTLSTALNTLGGAGDAFKGLLNATVPGRTQTIQNAAPAINSTLASADAKRRQEAASGTGRTGGTAEANRNAGAATDSNIDNVISQQLGVEQQQQTQKQIAGAQGIANVGSAEGSIGGTELQNAMAALGIGGAGQDAILSSSTQKGAQQSGFVQNLFDQLF
jgi:hypothetical protein